MHQFTVTEARTAIACPRIFYFDEHRFRGSKTTSKRVTRIWSGSSGVVTACGSLFHQTIERFNALAATSEMLRRSLALATQSATGQLTDGDENSSDSRLQQSIMRLITSECVNRRALHQKTPEQQQAFVATVRQYTNELTAVLSYSLQRGRSCDDLLREFFGDSRKRVDVTFYVGPDEQAVRVRGSLDYIYFDYRQNRNRLLDFKLMPADAVSKDLLQVALYALMHDQQHGTHPDSAVMYLHPQRQLVEYPWEQIDRDRNKVFDLLASMAAWSDFDESTGQGTRPPGELSLCRQCPWNRAGQCLKRLGPKIEGERLRWTAVNTEVAPQRPRIEAHRPPEDPPPQIYEDALDAETTEIPPAKNDDKSNSAAVSLATNGLLHLGQAIGTNADVTMPLADLVTHVAVVGAAGSGKSWLAKVLVEEVVRQGVPVVAIDPQGDLVQFLHAARDPTNATADYPAARNAFREQVEVRIWTPGSSHGQRLSLSPLKLPAAEDIRAESPQRRNEEWDALLSVAAGNLAELAQATGDREVQKTFLMEILRGLTRVKPSGNLLLSDIVAAIEAPDSLGIDNVDRLITKVQRERLMQRLYTRERGPTANLFSGGVPLDLQRFVEPLEPHKVPLNIIYLNALPDDEQKQFFVASFAAEIYRWMITTPSQGDLRLLVFLDEAKDFLPAGARKPPAKEPLTRLFSQGRKFGVSALVCTQSPRSVEYQVFSNCSTKFIGRLEAAQDVQRVAEWFRDNRGAPAWLPGRNGAANGVLVGRWPSISATEEGTEFRSRMLYSMHEGAWSPDRVEAEWSQSPLAQRLSELGTSHGTSPTSK